MIYVKNINIVTDLLIVPFTNQGFSLVVLSRFLWDTLSWHILLGCIDLNPMLCTWKQCIQSLGKWWKKITNFDSLPTQLIRDNWTFKSDLCSIFSLLFLHLFLYGCNMVMWRKTRINYNFIFEQPQTKELKHNDVFLICTTSMAAVIGVMFVHLSLVSKGYSYAQVQAIPGLLLLVTSRTSQSNTMTKFSIFFKY